MTHPTVLVIGAGMAGLAAARRLVQRGLHVTVLEKNDYIGGRVRTVTIDGFEIDTGAQFIANFYSNTLQLLSELHLQDALIPIHGATAIARMGKIHSLQTFADALSTDLLSFTSKITVGKMILPLLLHWRELDIHAFHKAYQLDTVSVAEYAKLNLNDELVAYLLQPLLSGIFYWTPEHTSQAMLFILLKASLHQKLFTLRHGLGQLPATMAAQLTVNCGVEVRGITEQSRGHYVVDAEVAGRKRQFTADAIVCATPAPTVPLLFPSLSDGQRTFFESICYSSGVNTALVLSQRLTSTFYGFVCPDREFRYLGSVNTEDAKHLDKLPSERDIITLFSSGLAGRELLHLDDTTIQERLWADLQDTGFTHYMAGETLNSHVERWRYALPEFDVGHFKRLEAFVHGNIEFGRVVFAGDYLGGPFIEGAITSGWEAADRLLTQLSQPIRVSV